MIKFSLKEQATTPVPTIFLKNYMCDAPPDYVRVYLYGLCLAHTGESLDGVAMEERLHLSSAQITSALEYWETKGFVKSRSAGKTKVYDFMTEPEEQPAGDDGRKAPVYEYKNFNNMLATLLDRNLSTADFNKIYDFTDVFGLPQDVVITMVEYCVAAKGKNVSVAYLDKVAQTWAEDGIDTREKAQQRVEDHRAAASGAKVLMRTMGITGRSPGKREMDYYDKWTEKWGFTQESIQYAMRDVEFSAKSEPFAYLDAILRNLYENGAVSSRKINEFNNAYARKKENIKEVLGALEYTRKEVTPRHERFYEEWAEIGYPHSIILLACRQTAKNGSRRFESIGGLLKKWKEDGFETEQSIHEHLKRQDDIKLLVEQVYECAGIGRQIGDADRKLYTEYVYGKGMSHDAMMYAAEISSIANEPSSFLRKVLSDWAARGVKTLDDAMKQNMDRFSSDMKGKNKKAFSQHTYSNTDRESQKKAAMKEIEEMEGLDD